MKRITIYILSILMLGLFTACKDDEFVGSLSTEDPGGPVTLNIGMMIPETATLQTRALLDEAAGENKEGYLSGLIPYLFIFEDTGNPESNYLRTLVHGMQIEKVGGDEIDTDHSTNGVNIRLQKFKATIDGTAENAIVHIVLIQPSEQETFETQLAKMTDRSEIGMFSGTNGLYTTGAAYWKRIELGKPINNSEDSQATLKSKLGHVKMVRNFVQVGSIGSAVEGFEILGFVVVNGMDHGYIAAYNENLGEDGKAGFVEFEPQNKNVTGENLYRYLINIENYIPVRHPDAYRDHPDQNLSWLNELTWNNSAKYVFERPVQDAHRTFVVLKAKRNGTEAYYKLDLGDYDQKDETLEYNGYGVFELYHLIRNISYNITITDVASDGHRTAEEAIGSLPSNNITANVETENVMSIGDGVDNIEIKIKNIYTTESKDNDGLTVVIIDDEEGKAYPKNANLLWQYTEGSTINNDVVEHVYPGNDLKMGGVISSYNPITETGWKGYELTFNDPGDVPQQETVKFYKKYGLSRDVTFILRKRWEFVNAPSDIEVYPGHYSYLDNSMPPFETLEEVRDYINEQEGKGGPGNVGSQRGAQFTVMFELPGDIPRSLFPLEFKIGFDRQNAENAYVGDATVVYGESMFDGQGTAPRMQFIKTVTWDYYNGSGDPGDKGHKIVTARFLTTTSVLGYNDTDGENGETSITKVRVANPYFTLGMGQFHRNVNDDDTSLDENRTTWSWYFGDPGWIKYFDSSPTAASDKFFGGDEIQGSQFSFGETGNEYYSYHGFCFAKNYETANQYGRYIGIPYGHSKYDPEVWFEVNNGVAPVGGYTARLTVTATSKFFKIGNKGYTRDGYFQYCLENADGTEEFQSEDKYITNYDKQINSNKGIPETYTTEFSVEEGKKIKWVKLWSVKHPGDTEDENAVTLYYAVSLRLTPKKEN